MEIAVGQTWKQQSVVGSIFEGSVQLDGDKSSRHHKAKRGHGRGCDISG